jgi:hypothetical protein
MYNLETADVYGACIERSSHKKQVLAGLNISGLKSTSKSQTPNSQ